jgi:hypothetical protein
LQPRANITQYRTAGRGFFDPALSEDFSYLTVMKNTLAVTIFCVHGKLISALLFEKLYRTKRISANLWKGVLRKRYTENWVQASYIGTT